MQLVSKKVFRMSNFMLNGIYSSFHMKIKLRLKDKMKKNADDYASMGTL